MPERFERLVSATLGVAGLAIAVTLIHREMLSSASTRQPSAAAVPTTVRDWQQIARYGQEIGDSTSPTRIIEFGDFECPACRLFHDRLGNVLRESARKPSLVFVHFPLPMHRFAVSGARAADCALRQQRFAQFHDALFADQDSLGLKSWVSYAKEAGVPNTSAFDHCVRSTSVDPLIQQGLSVGRRFEVTATPTVIINGLRYSRVPSESVLAAALRSPNNFAPGAPR